MPRGSLTLVAAIFWMAAFLSTTAPVKARYWLWQLHSSDPATVKAARASLLALPRERVGDEFPRLVADQALEECERATSLQTPEIWLMEPYPAKKSSAEVTIWLGESYPWFAAPTSGSPTPPPKPTLSRGYVGNSPNEVYFFSTTSGAPRTWNVVWRFPVAAADLAPIESALRTRLPR